LAQGDSRSGPLRRSALLPGSPSVAISAMAFQGVAEREQKRQLQAVPVVEPASDAEPGDAPPPTAPRFRRARLVALACGLLALAFGLARLGRARACSRALGAGWAAEKVELDGEGQMLAVAEKLNAVSSASEARSMVERAKKAARDAAPPPLYALLNATRPRLLPNSFVQGDERAVAQGTATCIFNVMEAMSATIGLGVDINAMARTCPSPRGADSEIACQVNSGIMVAYVGTIAAKLSLAATNCADTISVDAVCAAGITGVVAALGELAAGASLAAPTCSPHPPALPTTKISELGDQTLGGHAPGRRLLIGAGAVGNGVQCGVDASIVAENLANLGLAINQAANSGNCDSRKWKGKGGSLTRSLCTIDIGGAIAYFSQAVTFIQLAILNCKDFLDIKALCGASIAGIATAAAAIAPYGSAIHAGCALNREAKEATNTVIEARRLDGRDPFDRMNEVMGTLRATMAKFGQNASDVPSFREQNTASEADLRKLVGLMEPALAEGAEGAALRGAGLLGQECL